MKIIFLLLALNLAPSKKVVEQGNSFVPLSDLDAYVYMLAPNKRAGFISDKAQIEKNLITMLNINIVNHYIKTNGLINHKAFHDVEDVVNKLPVDLDDEFYLKLDLEKSVAHKNVKEFIIKKEMFSRMSDYIKDDFLKGSIDKYVKEYFLLNQESFHTPEKRDISLIEFDSDVYNLENVKDILTAQLGSDEFEMFSEKAIKYSSDKSVQLNRGHLKAFREDDFKYPFTKSVFKQKTTGVIPNIFKFNQNYFIVRINKIIPDVQPKFEDHKVEIIKRILPELVDSKLQNIINTQAKNKIIVNPEVLAHVFERYKVLIEE